MFPPLLLVIHRGRFDGKLVDKEGVWDMCWFAMHPVDWLAVEAGRGVVGDYFA